MLRQIPKTTENHPFDVAKKYVEVNSSSSTGKTRGKGTTNQYTIHTNYITYTFSHKNYKRKRK